MSRVWFVTGTSKGIGLAIVRAALRNGDEVVAATRRQRRLDVPSQYCSKLLHLTLDVSDPDQAVYDKAAAAAVEQFGRIDVLVNNAGFGAITSFEESSEETIREVFETNFFGLMRVTRAVLPVMRAQRSGRIFNIASAGGYAAGPVPYHASKFAVTGFSTALAFEVAPFGISVVNVAPGMFRTGFYAPESWKTEPDIHIPDYDRCRWQNQFVQQARQYDQPGDPDKLADLLLEAAEAEHPPLHLPAGKDAVQALQAYCSGIEKDLSAWAQKASRTAFSD